MKRPVCWPKRYSLAAQCMAGEQSGHELRTIQEPTRQYPTDSCG
jgi:hypothetical protein